MPKYEIDEDILETMLENAYRRGFAWAGENASFSEAPEYVGKAARDYADKIITEYFKSPEVLGETP